MAHVHAPRLRETSTTTGTGDYTTSGTAVPGGFATIASKLTANGDTGWFCVTMANQFEIVFLQRLTATTYARLQIFDGSNGTSAVNWGAGTKDIFSVTPPEAMSRRKYLSANLTIYVRSDATGDTGRTGLLDTAASAFLSWQAAYLYAAATYNLNGFKLTIQAGGSGVRAWSASQVLTISGELQGGGILNFQGDETTPTNCQLTATGDHCIRFAGYVQSTVRISGFRISSNAGRGIMTDAHARIVLNDLYFLSCNNGAFIQLSGNNSHIEDETGSVISFDADTASAAIFCDSAYIVFVGTVAIVGSRTWGRFYEAIFHSFGHFAAFTGSFTGSDKSLRDGAVLRITSGSSIPASQVIAPGIGCLFIVGDDSAAIAPAKWVKGTATNDDAAAGYVGEYLSNSLALPGTSLTTAVSKNVVQITLTPGDWDVSLLVFFTFGATTNWTRLISSASLVSNTLDNNLGRSVSHASPGEVPGAQAHTLTLSHSRFTVNANTIVYGVADGTFTVSTLQAGGVISARRIR